MASTSGQDEAILNKTNLSIDKFNSHISSVCHLALPNALSEDTIEGQASGFLAKFTLDGCQKIVVVMDNHFVASKEDAGRVIATFKYEGKNNEIKTLKLDPEIFFRTNQNPDYTFVGISEGDVKDLHENYRVIPVKLEQTRLTVEVNVDVIHVPQHPEGREKRLSYSKVCGISESEVFYKAGAYCGSSGSPVLYCKNSIMYVLALHKDGEVKLSDGSPASRGILMSAILDDMCGVKVCKRPDVCSSPLTGTQEIIRIAKRICGIWEIVAKGTEKFKSWEIDNIVLDNINYQTPVLKADKMLSDFKSRLGSREVLAEAIKESGYADVAERVRTGYYIKNKED